MCHEEILPAGFRLSRSSTHSASDINFSELNYAEAGLILIILPQ